MDGWRKDILNNYVIHGCSQKNMLVQYEPSEHQINIFVFFIDK